MNLRYETYKGGSASEVIRPEFGVDDDDLEDKDRHKAEGEERREEQEDSEGEKQEEEAETGLRRVVKLQDPRRPTEEGVRSMS